MRHRRRITDNHLVIGAILFLAIAAVLTTVLLFGRMERAAMAGSAAGPAVEQCLKADGDTAITVDADAEPAVATVCNLPAVEP